MAFRVPAIVVRWISGSMFGVGEELLDSLFPGTGNFRGSARLYKIRSAAAGPPAEKKTPPVHNRRWKN